jgi:hypothetical protein
MSENAEQHKVLYSVWWSSMVTADVNGDAWKVTVFMLRLKTLLDKVKLFEFEHHVKVKHARIHPKYLAELNCPLTVSNTDTVHSVLYYGYNFISDAKVDAIEFILEKI